MSASLRLGAALAALLALGAGESAAELQLTVENLRNERGKLHICVTRGPDHFPDCEGDPAALTLSQAATDRTATFSLAPGSYAVSLIHDENGNGKLDTLLGIPREGFAFSRNPRIGFGPPAYEDARIEMSGKAGAHTLRVRYLL